MVGWVRARWPQTVSPSDSSGPTRSVAISPPADSSRSSSSQETAARSAPMTTTSPSTEPRTSPGPHRPAEVRASSSATVTSAHRVAAAASAMAMTSSPNRRPGSATAIAARPWTGERVGTTPTSRPASRARVAARAASGWRPASLGSTTTSNAVDATISWRRSSSVTPPEVTTRAPSPVKRAAMPSLATTATTARVPWTGSGGGGGPRGGTGMRDRGAGPWDRLGGGGGRRGGDGDAVGAAGFDARLDRRSDVGDVDVHVPLAAGGRVDPDDDEAVAQPREALVQAGDGLLVGVGQQVLHLAAGSGGRLVRQVLAGVPVPGLAAGQRRARRLDPGDGGDERVQHEAQAGATGVDHARLTEHRQLAGGGLEGCARAVGGSADDVGQRLAALVDRCDRALGTGARDGEEGSLLRVGHRGVGGVGRLLEGRGEGRAIGGRLVGQLVGQALE